MEYGNIDILLLLLTIMQTTRKAVILGLTSLVLLSTIMAGSSASAQPCGKYCLMEYNAKIAEEQLKVQHGYGYHFLNANFGWGFLSHARFTSFGDQ